MRRLRYRRGMLFCALLGLAASLSACAPAEAGGTKMSGTYAWQGTEGPLEASFRPTDAPDEYEVRFRFEFDGKWKSWSGAIRGDLTEGPIEGRVEGSGSRAWNVRGRVADGVLTAAHFEIEGTGEYETGTLTLRKQAPPD